jgi:antagonist of KipI
MLEVLEAEGLASLQDAGRFGWRRFGVPTAGPMDHFAFQAANLLVGNPSDAAALEVGAGDVTLHALHDCVIAVTGAGFQLAVNSWDFLLWGSCFVRGGWSIRLTKQGFGMWAYVAAAGGFEASAVLGSRSTYLRGRFGGLAGRTLQPGDILISPEPTRSLLEIAARTLAEEARPSYTPSPTINVILGPQSQLFGDDELAAFFSTPYRVASASDRMGYRLEGAALAGRERLELTSEGMAVGSVQVPADGQPIAMMADCATTGGYPKIACVTTADLPLLAQCTPGQDDVRFHQVTVEAAQAAYRLKMRALHAGIMNDLDW